MKHFSEEDVLALKKSEQGGGFCGVFASLIVFVLVAAVVAVGLFIGEQPGTAVPTTATAIYGPTELVLVNTPTLRPTVTPAAPQLAPAIEAAMSPTPAQVATVAPTWTPLPTYTAVPSQTPAATYTPLPTSTPPATWTAVPTFTPFPTWTPPPAPTAVPLPDIQDAISAYGMSSATLTRLTWLVAALITFGFMALLVSVRPFDRDLRRIQRLIEMHLLAALKPIAAPPPALPAPVKSITLSEYQKRRTPVSPLVTPPVQENTSANTTGEVGPEVITVSVAPDEPIEVDEALMAELVAIWNRLERPSYNTVITERWGSKNTVRLAIVKRAIRWGRQAGLVKPRVAAE